MKTIEVTNYERIDYLKCRKYLNNLGISDKEINKALDQLDYTKESLTDTEGYSNESHKPHGVHEFYKTGTIHYKEYLHGYEKSCTRTGSIYRIPAQYQGLKHGEIIFQILKNRFDWFDTFLKDKKYKESAIELDYLGRIDLSKLTEEQKELLVNEIIELSKKKDLVKKETAWSLYEMHSEKYEMYLTTEFGSLYVPVGALLNKNFSLIEQRMKSYGLSYHDPINLSGYALNHRGRTEEQYKKDKQQDFLKMIKPLESKEAQLLKSYLS